MGKLRLVFRKEGRAVYISHLDLLRTFQRVFLREGLVLRHSQGFHPHPIISFAMPLSVGQSSQCEILDFELTQEHDGTGLAERFNAFMPEGIRAVDCFVPHKPVRELATLHCEVKFFYDNGVPALAREELSRLFAGESLVISKRTKRKEMADVDIRPMIESMDISEEDGLLRIDARVAAQNPGLNPALLEAAVVRYLPQFKPDFVTVHRIEMLDVQGNIFK
ncbi:MAG: TIGR03936 family radical SAM-associated protein [Oscillospiraceae bacterium]|nr:TIGR03936 family radical SAM-associated protein [Oscillospiraceae bacterium]